jgi:hypothetical protein
VPKAARANDRRLAHPYAKALDLHTFGSLGRLDRRTHPGKLARDLGAELIEHIGGSPTVTQRLLIERTIKMNLQLDALDAKLERGQWTANDQRTYGAMNNAVRLALRELEGMRPKKRARGPSVGELVAEHRRTE